MIDIPPGAEESRAGQLEARKEALLQCIETYQIAFILTSIYTMSGVKKLEEADFGRVSGAVLGSFQDDKRGFEENGRDYLVVDCRGEEGANNALPVRDKMAAILHEQLRSKDEKVWSGTRIPFVVPVPIPESVDEKERIKLQERTSFKMHKLLQADPTRVTLLPFLGESK